MRGRIIPGRTTSERPQLPRTERTRRFGRTRLCISLAARITCWRVRGPAELAGGLAPRPGDLVLIMYQGRAGILRFTKGRYPRCGGEAAAAGGQHEHAGGHGGDAGGQGHRARAGIAGRGCARRRRTRAAGRGPPQGRGQGRAVAGVAGPVRAGRGMRHDRRFERFHRRVPGRRVAAGRGRAGDRLRSCRVLRVRRGQDCGCGPPGHGSPGRMAQAGRRDMARDHGAAGLVRGRRSAGRVPGPPRVPGRRCVAGPAATGRGMAGVRGRQGCRGRGLVRHGGFGPPRRGPRRHRRAAGDPVPAARPRPGQGQLRRAGRCAARGGGPLRGQSQPPSPAPGLPARGRLQVRGRIVGGGPRGDPGRRGPVGDVVHPPGQTRR